MHVHRPPAPKEVAMQRLSRTVVLLLVFAAACSRSQQGVPVAPSAPPGSAASAASGGVKACPLGVEEARVDMVATAEGADLLFTVPSSGLDELRRRVSDAAALYGAGAHKGLGHHGEHLGAQHHGLRLNDLPPLEAQAEPTEGGARLHLRAKNAGDVADLRSRLRDRLDVVTAGPCD
jgi:hypothetical protein